MSRLLPPAFLFRFAVPISFVDPAGTTKAGTLPLPESARVAMPSVMDDAEPFVALSLGWNDNGLAISLTVTGKRKPPECDLRNPTESDGLQIWIDTRDTQSIHRASRFCHHFCAMPAGSSRGKKEPVVVQQPIARAKEDAPIADSEAIPIAVELTVDGYRLDLFLPAAVLNGYDPEASPRLGFYACVKDRELGDQVWSVGAEFPYAHDPSLWSTLELVRS